MADDVTVTFGASIERLIAATEASKRAIDGVAETVAGTAEVFKSLGEIAGTAFSVEAIVHFVEQMGELGLQTEKTMLQLGLTAQQVGVMGGVATLAGSSLEQFTTGIERMSLNIQKSTKDAFNPAAEGLHNLGLNAKDLIGLPTDQYFAKLVEAGSRFNPSLNLTNNLMAVGGRQFRDLLPLIMLGKEHFDELQEAVKETGSALTEAQTQGFAQTHEKATLLTLTLQGLKNVAFDQLKPTFDAIIEQMRSFVAEIRDSIKEGGAWSYVLSGLAQTLKVIALAFAGVAAMIRFLSVEAQAFWNSTKDNSEEVGQKLRADLDKISSEFKKTFQNLYGPTEVTVNKAPGGLDAASLDTGGKDALAAKLKAIQESIRADDDYYNRAAAHIESLFKLGQVTESQKTQILLGEVGKREQAELHWVNLELAQGNLTATQRQEFENKKTEIVRKAEDDRAKINEKALLEQEKTWTAAADQLASAFTSQLRGLLSGTVTWGQAMKNIMADLVVSWISSLTKFAAEWTAKQLFMAAFGQAQSGSEAAAVAAGRAAALPVRVAGYESDILAAASLGAANAFAALAAFPPAAAAAASAAFSGIESLGQVGIPKLDVGGYVLKSGLAMIHAGETVTPAAQVNSPFTGGGSSAGGDTHVHLNVNAVDAGSVMALFKQNRSGLAKMIAEAFSQNPGLRPAY